MSSVPRSHPLLRVCLDGSLDLFERFITREEPPNLELPSCIGASDPWMWFRPPFICIYPLNCGFQIKFEVRIIETYASVCLRFMLWQSNYVSVLVLRFRDLESNGFVLDILRTITLHSDETSEFLGNKTAFSWEWPDTKRKLSVWHAIWLMFGEESEFPRNTMVWNCVQWGNFVPPAPMHAKTLEFPSFVFMLRAW